METNAVGVQEVTAQIGHAFDFRRSAVKRIAHDGMANARKVDTDLVRSAGANADFQVSELFEALEHAVLRPGGAALIEARRHADAADGVAGDGSLNASGLLLDVSVDQSQIDLFDLPA